MKILIYSMIVVGMMVTGCNDSNNDTIGGITGYTYDTSPKKNVPIPVPPNNPTPPQGGNSGMYHHYNPDAYEMKGTGNNTSFVLCPGQTMSSCNINGIPFTKHGQLDEGRESWILYGQKHLSGKVTCTGSNGSLSVSVKSHGMQFGSCK